MFSRLLTLLIAIILVSVDGLAPRRNSPVISKQMHKPLTELKKDTTGQLEDANSVISPSISKVLSIDRGGGVGGVITGFFKLLIYNPALILFAGASVAIKKYEEHIPLANFLHVLVQLMGAAYVFVLLCKWQDSVEKKDESLN